MTGTTGRFQNRFPTDNPFIEKEEKAAEGDIFFFCLTLLASQFVPVFSEEPVVEEQELVWERVE